MSEPSLLAKAGFDGAAIVRREGGALLDAAAAFVSPDQKRFTSETAHRRAAKPIYLGRKIPRL